MIRNNLSEIIDKKGIKKTWLAQKAKIDRTTLSTVISNKKSTNLETGLRIAKALELKVEDIFELIDKTCPHTRDFSHVRFRLFVILICIYYR